MTRRTLILVAILFLVPSAWTACCGKRSGCCKKVSRSSVRTYHVSAKVQGGASSARTGRIGVVSTKEGPSSFLGVKFGASWPTELSGAAVKKDIPFEPKKRFRSFSSYFVRLKSGVVGEVSMEGDFGSREAAEAEARACAEVMQEKYGCAFTGTGANLKAVCNSSRKAAICKNRMDVVEVPVMSVEMRSRGTGVLRVTAKSLDASLFTRNVQPVSKKDGDAL